MRWLGLDWDEGPDVGGPHGPYFQSERLDRYRRAGGAARRRRPRVLLLLHAGGAEGEARGGRAPPARRGATTARARARAGARSPRARRPARRARSASACRRARRAFDDLVHGPIEFDNANIEDFVILRSDGQPTYHLSVVVDDVDMEITHVVRGDDHISNTPKQVLLYEAFGAPLPAFAHVPLILGPDKKRLSKRHGATSVMEYERQGYLPEAMVNFLALLGLVAGRRSGAVHARGAGRTRSRSTASAAATPCSTRRSSTGSTASTSTRLPPAEEIAARIATDARRAGLWQDDAYEARRREWLCRVVELLKPRARKLADFVEARAVLLRRMRSSTTRRR